jgi:hypothetical protein
VQAFTGTVEMEQRIWLRRKWLRQSALIDASGVLKITSASVYERLEYSLHGAVAVLFDGIDVDPNIDEGEAQQPMFQIKLDPKLQIDNNMILTFRLISSDDIRPWVHALNRQVMTPSYHGFMFQRVNHRPRLGFARFGGE